MQCLCGQCNEIKIYKNYLKIFFFFFCLFVCLLSILYVSNVVGQHNGLLVECITLNLVISLEKLDFCI